MSILYDFPHSHRKLQIANWTVALIRGIWPQEPCQGLPSPGGEIPRDLGIEASREKQSLRKGETWGGYNAIHLQSCHFLCRLERNSRRSLGPTWRMATLLFLAQFPSRMQQLQVRKEG